MKLYRLQYVTVQGEAREFIAEATDIMTRATTALMTEETTAVVIEDHKTAVEAELDALEQHVELIGHIRGGYQPQ